MDWMAILKRHLPKNGTHLKYPGIVAPFLTKDNRPCATDGHTCIVLDAGTVDIDPNKLTVPDVTALGKPPETMEKACTFKTPRLEDCEKCEGAGNHTCICSYCQGHHCDECGGTGEKESEASTQTIKGMKFRRAQLRRFADLPNLMMGVVENNRLFLTFDGGYGVITSLPGEKEK